jgi:hypothetical protein
VVPAGGAAPPGSVIDGRWVRLTPVAAYTPAAIADLMFRLGLRPEMGSPGFGITPVGSRFGEAAIIAQRESGEMLGMIGNVELADYPGVAGLVIYVDEKRARAGYAMEAWWRYVERIFALGATKVQMEVLSFNTPVHRIMRKIGARPEVVLREHFYIAGRHWDGTLYGFDRKAWEAVDRKYGEIVRRPAALASTRQDSDVVRLKREERSMKVDYLILADAAIAADGKHYMHGAGWDTVASPSFPVVHPHMSAALRLRVPGGDPAHRVGVDVVSPAGMSILPAPIYTDVTPAVESQGPSSEDRVVCLAFSFSGLQFTNTGDYAVVVTIDGVEAERSQVFLRQMSGNTQT